MKKRLTARTAALLAITALLAGFVPAEAEAGCLMEHRSCRKCAKRLLSRSIWRLDLGGILTANIMFADCDIELYHCLFFAEHSEASCAI